MARCALAGGSGIGVVDEGAAGLVAFAALRREISASY